jgi:hypothetical protein
VAALSASTPANENSLYTISSLVNRLTYDETLINAQGSTITSHTASLNTQATTLNSQSSSLTSHSGRLTSAEGTIGSQGSSIAAQVHHVRFEPQKRILLILLASQANQIASAASSITSHAGRISATEGAAATLSTTMLTRVYFVGLLNSTSTPDIMRIIGCGNGCGCAVHHG